MLIATLLLSIVGCKDKKADQKAESKYENIGGDANANRDLLKAMLAGSGESAVLWKMDPMQMLKKSEVTKNEILGGMLESGLSTFDFIQFDQPIYAAVSASGMNEGSVIVMIGIRNKEAFVSNLSVYASEMIDDLKDAKGGYTFGNLKMKDGQYAQMAINNNFCLVQMNSKFMNAEDAQKKIEAMMDAGIDADAKVSQEMTAFFASKADFVMSIKPDALLNNLDPKMLQKAAKSDQDINIEALKVQVKDGSSLMSWNFGAGAIEMELVNNYPNMPALKQVANGSVPADYSALLTNDQLIGFFAGQFNMDQYTQWIKEGNPEMMAQFTEKTGMPLESVMGVFDGSASVSFIGMGDLSEYVQKRLKDGFESGEDAANSSLDRLNGLEDDSQDEVIKEESHVVKNSGDAQMAISNMLVTIGITNDSLITSVLDTAKNVKKVGNMYELAIEPNNPKKAATMYMAMNGNRMMFSGNKAVISEFAANGKLKEVEGVNEYFSKPFNGYMAFDTMVSLLSAAGGEKLQEMPYLKLFDRMVFTGDMTKMSARVEMKDGETNFLKQIADVFLSDDAQLMNMLAGAMQ